MILIKRCFLILALCIASNFAQPIEDDKMADKIKALKQELEDYRRQRDKIITKRWDDKRAYNESREKFNQDYDDLKDKLEVLSHERESIKEAIEAALRDVEELKAKKEAQKVQFLGLSSLQRTAVSEISEEISKRFPRDIVERTSHINKVKKSAEVKRENPKEILDDIVELYKSEIDLTKSITIERKEFLKSDQPSEKGHMLKIGTMSAAFMDDSSNTWLLLRTANSTGQLYDWQENLTKEAKTQLELNMKRMTTTTVEGPFHAAIPMDVLRNRLATKGYTKPEAQGFGAQVQTYFENGGIWMWPLSVIAVIALLLLLERFFFWAFKNSGSTRALNNILELVEKDRIGEALKLCEKNKRSSVFAAVHNVISNREKSREIAEKELQEVLMKESPRLERRLTTISVLGAVAPLLGLLGTVAGMIGMFNTITIYGTSDPKLMAGDISIALITTQVGLAISVPVMIGHNFVANRVDGLVNKMESYALKTLNLLWPNG